MLPSALDFFAACAFSASCCFAKPKPLTCSAGGANEVTIWFSTLFRRAHGLTARAEQEEEATGDAVPMPELQHNLRLLVDLAEADIRKVDGRLRHAQDTAVLLGREQARAAPLSACGWFASCSSQRLLQSKQCKGT